MTTQSQKIVHVLGYSRGPCPHRVWKEPIDRNDSEVIHAYANELGNRKENGETLTSHEEEIIEYADRLERMEVASPAGERFAKGIDDDDEFAREDEELRRQTNEFERRRNNCSICNHDSDLPEDQSEGEEMSQLPKVRSDSRNSDYSDSDQKSRKMSASSDEEHDAPCDEKAQGRKNTKVAQGRKSPGAQNLNGPRNNCKNSPYSGARIVDGVVQERIRWSKGHDEVPSRRMRLASKGRHGKGRARGTAHRGCRQNPCHECRSTVDLYRDEESCFGN